jgi:hypothetical protein
MRVPKKAWEKAARKLQKDLFFGRKSFRTLKIVCNNLLQNSSQIWQSLPKPVTKKDFEEREFVLKHIELAIIMYSAIKNGMEYRNRIKFRNCRYKKYVDSKNKKIIFKCSFYKIIEKQNKINYFVLYLKDKRKKGIKAELIKTRLTFQLPVVEKGRFRYSPILLNEFNMFFYPKNDIRYGYVFKGDSNKSLTATKICM